MTLVGFFERGYPAAHGNCFSAALEDGTGVRILNFHYENLKELLRRGTLVWPVQVHIIRKGYAVIADPRVPNEWYQKDFCEVCAPMELLPLPQRLRFAMAVERGEIEVNGDSITCRILPADQPRKLAIGWTIKEKIGVCVVNSAAWPDVVCDKCGESPFGRSDVGPYGDKCGCGGEFKLKDDKP
jgi:hypothetical protein